MSGISTGADRWRRTGFGAVVALLGLALAGPAQAEDLKGKWYFGGNLSFLSTTDSVRSNAAINEGPAGDDGIPFTFDMNEIRDCSSPQVYCDPRPDDLVGREASIEETFKYDLTAGFGLTSWLSLQLDASYFKGNVGPVDAFLRDHFPVATGIDPTSLNTFADREFVIPSQAGELTEIPVTLTGIVRFRKDSPLNPYLGAGVGMIFANLDKSDDVDTLNARLRALHITGAGNEFNRNILPAGFEEQMARAQVPLLWPLQVDVEDAFEWHLTGGAEYFVNDRFSLVFDARYTFADQSVTLDLAGEDQIVLGIFSERLFRPDGSLRIFRPIAEAPNTLCEDIDYRGLGCTPETRPPGQRVNPQGSDPAGGGARHDCSRSTNVGDFDKDGQTDLCYGMGINASPTGATAPFGEVVVQGGSIDLTGFSIALGVRLHF